MRLPRWSIAVVVVLSSIASPAFAAVHIEQKANAFDRAFERLPDLRLVRGGKHKVVPLVITTDDPAEQWTLAVDQPWMSLSTTSGTGSGAAVLRFDAAQLATLDALSGHVVITDSTDASDTQILDVRLDVWPNLSTATTRAELIEYAKDPANWPSDGFGGSWELWGFIPDETTHPGRNAGANVRDEEKTPCSGGNTTNCTREGQAGLAAGQSADQAWLLSTGDPRIVIAELDSGIKWSERSLNTKFYLHARELFACPPPGAAPVVGRSEEELEAAFDVNGDGVFNVRDYDEADWLTDVNANGLRDPQDLIWADDGDGLCSDGIDDDGNGYTDDIAGWDFFWNDNDPSDDSDFGHGTGEANDSAAEAHDDEGGPGICMRCRVMPVRVGDSFVVDINQYADGVVFAVESGASLVQEALGSLNNSPYAQQATDWAYNNNVPVIASAADETSYHHNYPSNLEHTLMVHAIVFDDDGDIDEFSANTYLNFNNCTNWGAHLMLSTPGEGCSSEATGKTAGQTALMMSYYLQLQDGDDPYYDLPFTSEEVYQALVASADDIDVTGAESDESALALQKFQSNEGWDLQFGYGRNNARRALEVVRDQKIPPEANIESPRWFEVFDPSRTASFDVKGTVKSARNTDLRWELYVAEGVVGKSFTKIAEGSGGKEGELLGSVSLKKDGPLGSLVVRSGEPAGEDPEQFTATVELRVFGKNPAGDDVQGVFRKAFGVRTDPTTLAGFPLFIGASGESSPKITDLDGDGSEEIVMGDGGGLVHAIQKDGSELPGFPAAVDPLVELSDAACDAGSPKCHRTARPFRDGVIDPASTLQSIVATVAVGDLDGDGAPCRDIVAATMDGFVFAFDCEGNRKDGFPTTLDPSFTPDGNDGARRCERDGEAIIGCRDEQLFSERGIFASPALVDLDRDGSLEVVIGAGDQHAYAWHHDGTLVNGWPVELRNSASARYPDEGGIVRYDDRIISSPVVAFPFGDGTPFVDATPVVVMGTNERIENQNAVFLYAIQPDGNAHAGGPFPTGWPTQVLGFIPEEILPYVGRGNPNAAVAGDLDGDGKDEIVNAGMGGSMSVLNEAGVQLRTMFFTKDIYGKNSTTDEAFALPVINNPSIADIDNNGYPDIINGTAGSGLVQVAAQGGRRNNFDHSVSAWDNDNGVFLDGFPHKVHDYQFFMNYAVADLEGTGSWNVISGDGGYYVYAPNAEGKEAKGFPKWTAGWHIGTPALGDLDGDERIDIAAPTREGWLWAWKTDGHVGGPANSKLPAIQWESFKHDDNNTGNSGGPLKSYPKLAAPDDSCAAGCCCQATTDVASLSARSAAPWSGAVAIAVVFGTLFVVRRRPRGA